jgi:hypothetical protein
MKLFNVSWHLPKLEGDESEFLVSNLQALRRETHMKKDDYAER